MIKTNFGTFDGNSWELFCQRCLKIKYQKEGYQELYASQGDLGIEGFTRTGIVFQCYCPDDDYEPQTLYEKQRDKITTDLNKLIGSNKDELLKYLHGIKIKQWYFLTPMIRRKDLTNHALNKRDEFRQKKIKYLDEEFDVLVENEDFFSIEVAIIKKAYDEKIEINPEHQEDAKKWKSSNNELVSNAITKHEKRLQGSQGIEKKAEKLAEKTINEFLEGEVIKSKWKLLFPEKYEKFLRIVAYYESQTEEKCLTNDVSNNELYKRIKDDFYDILEHSFPELDSLTIDKLSNAVIADWLLRCPINFE